MYVCEDEIDSNPCDRLTLDSRKSIVSGNLVSEDSNATSGYKAGRPISSQRWITVHPTIDMTKQTNKSGYDIDLEIFVCVTSISL